MSHHLAEELEKKNLELANLVLKKYSIVKKIKSFEASLKTKPNPNIAKALRDGIVQMQEALQKSQLTEKIEAVNKELGELRAQLKLIPHPLTQEISEFELFLNCLVLLRHLDQCLAEEINLFKNTTHQATTIFTNICELQNKIFNLENTLMTISKKIEHKSKGFFQTLFGIHSTDEKKALKLKSEMHNLKKEMISQQCLFSPTKLFNQFQKLEQICTRREDVRIATENMLMQISLGEMRCGVK